MKLLYATVIKYKTNINTTEKRGAIIFCSIFSKSILLSFYKDNKIKHEMDIKYRENTVIPLLRVSLIVRLSMQCVYLQIFLH